MNPKHIRAFYIGHQRFHVTDGATAHCRSAASIPMTRLTTIGLIRLPNPAGTSAAKAGRSVCWPAWTALKSPGDGRAVSTEWARQRRTAQASPRHLVSFEIKEEHP